MSPTSRETAMLLAERPAVTQGPGPAAPIVRLLGPVFVDDAPGPTPLSRPGGSPSASAHEIVAMLALHPDGVTSEQLLPISRCARPGDLRTRLSRIRRWLGCTPDGVPRLRRAGDQGPWQLADIETDWALLDVLTSPGRPLRDLLDALLLVRGIPFSGSGRRYTWAGLWRTAMTEQVTEVAHRAAEAARQVGDLDAARWAVSVGRLVDPESMMLWRDALEIELCAEPAADAHAEPRHSIDPSDCQWLLSPAKPRSVDRPGV